MLEQATASALPVPFRFAIRLVGRLLSHDGMLATLFPRPFAFCLSSGGFEGINNSCVVSSECRTRKMPGFFSFEVWTMNPPSNPFTLTIFLYAIAMV
jgi:hypothetical protein